MPERILTLRALSRATLARQLLLERATLAPDAALEQVAGLQAQELKSPYISLWSRLEGFQRDHLTDLITNRSVVRATLMRVTIHMVTAQDYRWMRPLLQPSLTRLFMSAYGKRATGMDLDRLVGLVRTAVEERPRSFAQFMPLLLEEAPGGDPMVLAHAVRTHLPLVQFPPSGVWGHGGNPVQVTAESWLGGPLATPTNVRPLVLRYLAAFGPATVMDMQRWAGMTRLKEVFAAMRPDLRVYRTEDGKELFDLPDAPLPAADTPAPVRFLPDFDNLLLAHDNRTRVIAPGYYQRLFLSERRNLRAFLVDGWVRGAWSIERTRDQATLVVEPFTALEAEERNAVAEEGERLLRWMEDGTKAFDVQFAAGA